ncbi:MAG: hypothetical protein EXR93_01325 [Gemmatimonadetes bacterium]|nr:hypothetical protein [Gemmatimonadota bacterium]
MSALDRLVDTLEQNPDYRCFLLDGQAVLADDYLEVRPEQAVRLAALVKAGRLLLGPWFVLADELLSSGESLVRNLLLGRRRGRSLGGWLPLGYSPDAFGHPATLPTLLSGFGIRHAILWRGYGGEPGQDLDLFRWIAPDGAEVLVHHLPPPGYEIGVSLPGETKALKARWNEIETMLVSRAAADSLLLPAGADHHAPDPDLPARVAALRKLARHHEFRIGSPLEYFATVPRQLRVPRVAGELRFSSRYAWTLQGTHSTRAGLKRAVREADLLLTRWAEPQVVMAELSAAGEGRRAVLRAAWREHLLNHFHDSICGSVSDTVATEVIQRAESVSAQARGLLVDALHDRLGQDRSRARGDRAAWKPALVLVNPSPRPVRRVVEATVTVFERDVLVGRPDTRKPTRPPVHLPYLVAADGSTAPVQVLEEFDAYERLDSPDHYPDQDRVRAFRVAVDGGELPAFGAKALRVDAKGGPRAPSFPPVRATDARLALLPLDIESDRDEGDTYTFEPVAGDRAVRARWSPPQVVWRGPLVAAVAREFKVGERTRGRVSTRLDAGSSLLRFAIEGVNLQRNHRLRVRFRPSVPVTKGAALESVADMPLGPAARPYEWHDPKAFPREWPVATAPVHRYVSVAAAGHTVFVRGSCEYELGADGALAITVFRAVGDLSRGDLRARPGHAAWPLATPLAQELGHFRLELAMSAATVNGHSGAAEWDAIEALAEEFHAAPAGLMLRYAIGLPEEIAGPELSGAGLSFLALKPREEGPGTVARCLNLTGDRVGGTWTWPRPITRAHLARLDETVITELVVSRDRRQVRFTAEPRAPVTVIIES